MSKLRPDEVNEGNVNEALEQMIEEMKPLVTTARRVSETARALAIATGRREDRLAAEQAERAVTELDTALAALLEES